MKLRITSITASEVGELVSKVTTGLEDRLRPAIEPKDYGGGIGQVVVFFVCVEDDPIENERYCAANNRAGRYRDMLTGRMIRFVGIAVPENPRTVLGLPEAALCRLLVNDLIHELEFPRYALPPKFDRARFLHDLKAALPDT